MSDNTSAPKNPSEEPYDAAKDPDADPEQLASRNRQPDQAEGADDPEEYGAASR